MQIVIDIPENDIEVIKNLQKQGFASRHEIAILNGTPLPKGHGRLIDADKLEFTYVEEVGLEGQMHCVVRSLVIKEAPTVIEAEVSDNG